MKKKEILFFSNNTNKINEILNFFKKTKFKILNLNDYYKIQSPLESGKNFKENAKIKSIYGFNKFKKPCFADDSGICLEAMNGGPGILSKDFIESSGGQKEAFEIMQLITKEKDNYKAIFQTSICLTIYKNKHIFFHGSLKGKISKKIKGENGFGYDPIFIPQNYSKTFAQMKLKEKNMISHRCVAIKKLKKYLLD